MALSGSIQQSYAGGNVTMRIDWTATQNEAANTSTITAVAKMIYSSNEDVYQRFNNTFRIDGDEYKYTFTEESGGAWGREFTLYTKTKTVAHDASGSRSVELYNEYRMERTIFGYTLGSISVSGTAVLDPIAGASGFSSVTPSVEVNGSNTCAVAIERATSGTWHKVRFYVNDTYQHTTGAVQTGTSYAIPVNWLNAFPSAAAGSMTVTLTTYRDQALTQQVGSPVSRTVTLTVPASMKPAVASGWATAQPYNEDATISAWGIYLQNRSKAQVAFDTTKETLNLYGATVTSRKITYGTTTVTAAPYRTPVLTASGSQSITCVITDSRGRSASQTITIQVEAYSAPTPTGPTAYRSTQAGAASSNGTYIAVRAGVSYSSAGGHNSASLRARYRATGGSWSAWEAITAGAVSVIGGGAIATTSTYTAQIQAVDALGETGSASFEIGTKTVALHIRDGGTGMGLGKYGETSGALEIGWWLKPGNDTIRRMTLMGLSPRATMPRNGVSFYASLAEMGGTEDMTTQTFGATLLQSHELAVLEINANDGSRITDVPTMPGIALFMKAVSAVYGLLLGRDGTMWFYKYNAEATDGWKQITMTT